ncbi:uncharacterized protein BX664DRAFT_356763 [Halteromyces radiatus]|uniref:uncharacterized protein n=1 Tax=Halteromyces radiatus TaxID=101107 RepID=UPI002220FEAC|nr:uncharacterized protein BX664DRAFT_356763 [Halteromyces radiatus]KAI8097533.1 hypothetical protein BX664DRAFT_356763 [Halteromyces radiatus]
MLNTSSSSPLTFLCTIHHVKISIITEQSQEQLIGEQYTIEIYVSTNEALLLQCHPSLPIPSQITINVPSQSKACLYQPHILTLPHTDSGLWSLDCSETNEQEFSTFQDILTYFIKFENQHQMRNTLAMMNPSTYQVTQVIAENIYMDHNSDHHHVKDSDFDDLIDDDFINTRENYYGQKLPVTMDESVFKEGLQLRKVRLIYQTSHCMDVGSDWLARRLINAGDSIADYIQTGCRSIEEERWDPSVNQQQLILSSKQRHYFDLIYNLTTMTGQWISNLINFTAIKQAIPEFQLPAPRTKLGSSALQAATRVMEGTTVAAGTVLAASRQGLIQVIEKKYGPDAGYIAEKLMGSDTANEDVLVYFDSNGVSRHVVLQHPSSSSSSSNRKKNRQQENSYLVYEDKDTGREDTQRQLVYDIEESGDILEERKPERLVLV